MYEIEVYGSCFILSITICLTLCSLFRYVTITFDNNLSLCKLSLKPYKFIFYGMCFQTIEQALICVMI
jgi:hypothetical protein